MGLMSDDGNFAAVPPMLAELVGVPHTTAALKIERSAAAASPSIARSRAARTRWWS